MKKIFCLLIFALSTTILFGQETKTQLETRFNVIRNETVAGANTKVRVANAYQELADGTIGIYPITGSGTNAYTSSLLGLDSYAGQIIFIKFSNANTDSVTIDISSKGVVEIQKDEGGGSWVDLESGDIVANKLYRIYHDGTRFEIDLGGSGAGLEDMDYGDITVSGDGTVMTIDNLAVGNVKINDVSVGKITGFGTGIGTFLATPSSSNLAAAVTDETGSGGSVVFATGPTLSNPIVGTQSANDNSTKAASTAYADAKVADAINNGTTAIAPSENAVFDALVLKHDLTNSATSLSDGGSITITTLKHTLTTTQATITFTDSYTGDFTDIEVTFNTTSSTWTFPSSSLCIFNGTATGNNVMAVTGASGDKILLSRVTFGSNKYYLAVNMGQ